MIAEMMIEQGRCGEGGGHVCVCYGCARHTAIVMPAKAGIQHAQISDAA